MLGHFRRQDSSGCGEGSLRLVAWLPLLVGLSTQQLSPVPELICLKPWPGYLMGLSVSMVKWLLGHRTLSSVSFAPAWLRDSICAMVLSYTVFLVAPPFPSSSLRLGFCFFLPFINQSPVVFWPLVRGSHSSASCLGPQPGSVAAPRLARVSASPDLQGVIPVGGTSRVA